jgi:hypothetical protein
MAYTYTTKKGTSELLVAEPAATDNVATGDEAIRQIKSFLNDTTFITYPDVTGGGSGTMVFNDDSESMDFRFEGATDVSLLFLDASTNRVGISTSSPDALLDVSGDAIIGDGSNSTDLTLKTGGTNSNTIDFDNGGVDARIQHSDNNGTFKIYTGGDMSTEAILINDTGLVSFSSCPTAGLRIDDATITGTPTAQAGHIKVLVGTTAKYIQLFTDP